MCEIIQVGNASYARYEELLLRRDRLAKEAFQYEQAYYREFGDLILDVFHLKIECIEKKKALEYCLAEANFGRTADPAALRKYLAREMADFWKQLHDMTENMENAKKSSDISELDLLMIKRIYRRLVKLIHPDINPLTSRTFELFDLWHRIQIAYRCNDKKALEELEILTNAALEQLGIGKLELEIPDIEQKIVELEEEIERILETDPYMYRYILENEETTEQKKEDLREELKAYIEYSAQLTQMLDDITGRSGGLSWLMN